MKKLHTFLREYQKEGESQRKEISLPTIYTHHTPFTGATLKRLEVTTKTYRKPKDTDDEEEIFNESELAASSDSQRDSFPIRHKIDLKGPIFPDTIMTLSKLFQKTQAGEFLAAFTSFPSMSNMNKIVAKVSQPAQQDGSEEDYLTEPALPQQFTKLNLKNNVFTIPL